MFVQLPEHPVGSYAREDMCTASLYNPIPPFRIQQLLPHLYAQGWLQGLTPSFYTQDIQCLDVTGSGSQKSSPCQNFPTLSIRTPAFFKCLKCTFRSSSHSQGPRPSTSLETGLSTLWSLMASEPRLSGSQGFRCRRALKDLMSVTPPIPLARSSDPHSSQPSGLPGLRSRIRRIMPPHTHAHHPRKTHTDHRSSPLTPEHSPLGKHAESNLFPSRTTETRTGSSSPAQRLGCHAPQAYWPKGADPCPTPRAVARPLYSHYWRYWCRPPPSSSYWSICKSAVPHTRAGGAAPCAR